MKCGYSILLVVLVRLGVVIWFDRLMTTPMPCVPSNFLNFGSTIYNTTKIKESNFIFLIFFWVLNELLINTVIELKLISLKRKITIIDSFFL